jgi:hypothetical protein
MSSKKPATVAAVRAVARPAHWLATAVARPARWLAPAVAVVALAGCGGAVKVQPTTPKGSTKLASRGVVDSPLTSMHNHLGCLRADHLPVQVVSPIKLQIGTWPSGPTVVFTATDGISQGYQIDGQAQGAEVIGTALLYPNQGSDSELSAVEDCLSEGVSG